MDLLKANFAPKEKVEPEEVKPDPKEEYRKEALKKIGGSMVFVERQKLYWDGK